MFVSYVGVREFAKHINQCACYYFRLLAFLSAVGRGEFDFVQTDGIGSMSKLIVAVFVYLFL